MTATQPPAAPVTPKTDEETVNAILNVLRSQLARDAPSSEQAFIQAVGQAILAGIISERRRAVALLNEKAHKASAAAEVARAGGAPGHEFLGQKYAAAALARNAQLLAEAPGAPACTTCGGRRFVLSSVVTASGAPRAMPCPRCAAPAAPAAPAPTSELTLPPPGEPPAAVAGLALVPPKGPGSEA